MPPLSKKNKSPARRVLYPKPFATMATGKDCITVALAKKLMGWQEETDKIKFGTDYFMIDENGVKVRCTNNIKNRELRENWARTIAQDILNGNWKFNGETIIIGETGIVLDGQHRLIALILAGQIWEKSERWKALNSNEPVIKTAITYGADESDDVARTRNNVKPRTLGDVIASLEVFADLEHQDRAAVSKMTAEAIQVLWARTGACADPYTPRRTHSEAVQFLERHGRIALAVKHIYEEDAQVPGGKRKISQYLRPGAAAALLFLMGSANSSLQKYREADAKDDKVLDWSLWDKACEFWVLVGNGTGEFLEVRQAIMGLYNEEGEGGGTLGERMGIMCKAWLEFNDGAITQENLQLEYETDEERMKHLINAPTVGGIDIGDTAMESAADEEVAVVDESEEETVVEEPVTPVTVAKKVTKEEKKAKLLENRKKIKKDASGQAPEPPEAKIKDKLSTLTTLRNEHPGLLLVFKCSTAFEMYTDDAEAAASDLCIKVLEEPGTLAQVWFTYKEVSNELKKLLDAGRRIGFVNGELNGKGLIVTELKRDNLPFLIGEGKLTKNSKKD